MRKGRKEQGQFHRRPNIALRLAAILLVLVCLSVWLMNGLFAKYRTSDEGGDGARVISFGDISLTETGDFANNNGTAVMIPGVDLIKDIEIRFGGSEASTYVFVEMKLSKNWNPTTDHLTFGAYNNALVFKINNEINDTTVWEYVTHTVADTYISYVYCYEVEPNEELTADFIADNGKITVTSTITKANALAVEDMNIDVRAVVVQSNGFSDSKKAWASVTGISN